MLSKLKQVKDFLKVESAVRKQNYQSVHMVCIDQHKFMWIRVKMFKI